MPMIQGFLNVYRSGWFHRCGKPRTCDRHAGDFYLTESDALADIDPVSHYITTVPVEWFEPEPIQANPCDSIPIPLRESRRA